MGALAPESNLKGIMLILLKPTEDWVMADSAKSPGVMGIYGRAASGSSLMLYVAIHPSYSRDSIKVCGCPSGLDVVPVSPSVYTDAIPAKGGGGGLDWGSDLVWQ